MTQTFTKEKNREYQRLWARRWRAKNPERNRNNWKTYNLVNRDKINKRRREKYHADPERYRASRRKYYWKDPEKARKLDRARYKQHPDYYRTKARLYRQNNREKCRQVVRKWQILHPDHGKYYQRQRRLNDLNGCREYERQWYHANRDKVRMKSARRWARLHNAKGSYTLQEWQELKARYNQRCAICKLEKKLTIDHIIPLSKNGSNYIDNIQPLCKSCNSSKRDKIWQMS